MNDEVINVEVGISFTVEIPIYKKELGKNFTEEDIKDKAIYEAYSRYDRLEWEEGVGELNIINCELEKLDRK